MNLIYQVLPRLWGKGKFSSIDESTFTYWKNLGMDTVWYTGVIRHASASSGEKVIKGEAGSPYAITDYYDVNPYLADEPARRMEEFEDLVKRTHEAGLKLVMDFVPNHVAREYHSISCPEGIEDLGAGDKTDEAFNLNNNFYYFPGQTLVWNEVKDESAKAKKNTKNADSYVEKPAKVTGNDVFGAVTPSPYDWYETIKLNYGVDYKADGTRVKAWENADGTITIPSTWVKMSDILLYWCSKGVDAFRCDMSEMVPYEFWHYGIGRAPCL